jgi:RNA-directed DNA polymerase
VRRLGFGDVGHARLTRARDSFDRLRAILHNCAVRGPTSENREGLSDFRAHLAGRVAHVASSNPLGGANLANGIDRIRWSSTEG